MRGREDGSGCCGVGSGWVSVWVESVVMGGGYGVVGAMLWLLGWYGWWREMCILDAVSISGNNVSSASISGYTLDTLWITL